MFKSSSKLLVCLTLLVLTAAPAMAYEGFTVESYDVEVTVGKDRIHHVREDIDLNFVSRAHGLLREIPLSSSQEPYMIDNVEVEGGPFTLEQGSNVLGVRIGEGDSYVYGPKSYGVSYDILYEKDGDRKNDIVYVSPIGTDWDTPIRSASVTINLPTDDIKSVTVYKGAYGADSEISGANISGASVTLKNVYLNSHEGLTFYIELPEGTFSSAPRSLTPVRDTAVPGIIAFAALMAVLAFVRWVRIGRDDRIVPTVEFYSPDGMNPAEVSYIVNRTVDTSAVSAMIFFWASKGYMNYRENEDGSFELQKLRDMGAERPEYERRAFDALFEDGTEVTSRQIEKSYYNEAQGVIVNAEECFRGERALERGSNAKASAAQLLLCLLPPLIYGVMAMPDAGLFGFAGVVPAAAVYGLTAALIQRGNGNGILPAVLVFLAGIGGGLLASRLMEARFFGSQLRCLIIAGLSVAGAFFAALIHRRTDYATGIIGRCLGFRNFLVTAEKDRLEKLVEENPSYFFDTLPFAFVLGVTDVWAKKFEGLIKEPPDWYRGYYGGYAFTPLYMTGSVARASSGLSAAYARRAVKNAGGNLGGFGDGGFSGGGFSGGGGGGGGGSAW